MNKIKELVRYYVKPNSLVWWSGVLMITLGVLQTLGADSMPFLVLAEVVAGLAGASPAPAQMILFGITALGIGARKGEQG